MVQQFDQPMEQLSIKDCRDLLKIQSKDTINQYLKTLKLFGNKYLNWEQIRQVLELQIYLGLKHGRNSKENFRQMTRQQIEETFQSYGVDVDARLKALKQTHRDSVQQKGVKVVSLLKK
ncbi:hypothetical protein [Anabaena azotica]|uniref:Integrase SAM-like N-terminal domain-containing protein n=1 Tax=Anabaena azotica FACHB-119 TaxID=947527 RepID=A0ABR8DF82_9NOST|nr:hypothetical protein [Anabaena azotica]MBD2505602.1 hypothetical protein [Anabaena azotica FACHB-119]